MFEHLIEANGLMAHFKKRGLDDNDLVFIKEQIYGPLSGKGHQGRPVEKAFLYEIVANKRNGRHTWFFFEAAKERRAVCS